jgi:hypothetical protein
VHSGRNQVIDAELRSGHGLNPRRRGGRVPVCFIAIAHLRNIPVLVWPVLEWRRAIGPRGGGTSDRALGISIPQLTAQSAIVRPLVRAPVARLPGA